MPLFWEETAWEELVRPLRVTFATVERVAVAEEDETLPEERVLEEAEELVERVTLWVLEPVERVAELEEEPVERVTLCCEVEPVERVAELVEEPVERVTLWELVPEERVVCAPEERVVDELPVERVVEEPVERVCAMASGAAAKLSARAKVARV